MMGEPFIEGEYTGGKELDIARPSAPENAPKPAAWPKTVDK